MPIVEPLRDHPSDELAALAADHLEALGFVPNSLMTLARRPEIAVAFVRLLHAVMAADGRLTGELKRLIAAAASFAAGCRYCQAHTAHAAGRLGASEARIASVWDWERSALYTPAEKAALAFAQAAASAPNGVDDAVAAELKRHWDDDEIVGILAVVSLFGFLNRWNDTMGTTLEDDAREVAEDVLSAAGWSVGKHA